MKFKSFQVKKKNIDSLGCRAMIVCRFLGRTSEVWLHRQILGFNVIKPTVVCWGRENECTYPLGQIPVMVLPFDPLPHDGSARWLWRASNIVGGNFYGTIGKERRQLDRIVISSRPDVMLCQFGTVALRLLPVAVDHGIPIVAHFHGVDITAGLNNFWYRSSLVRQLKHFAAMVVVADYQREILIDLGASPDKIHVIPCGVPIDHAPITGALSDSPCRFLAVGRLVEKKAPAHMLRAFALCLEQQADCQLSVIGEGPLLPLAKRLSVELGIADKVDFMGGQPTEVVLKKLSECSVFIQHSVTSASGDKEGWPVSIAEAMAAGIPVISTRHAGITQQVIEGQTGFLVEENDWKSMAQRMAELARDPVGRVVLGAAGRKVAELAFDQNKMIKKLEKVLLELAVDMSKKLI